MKTAKKCQLIGAVNIKLETQLVIGSSSRVTQLAYLLPDHLKLSLYICYSFAVLASYFGVKLVCDGCTGFVFSTLSELAIVPSILKVFRSNAYNWFIFSFFLLPTDGVLEDVLIFATRFCMDDIDWCSSPFSSSLQY